MPISLLSVRYCSCWGQPQVPLWDEGPRSSVVDRRVAEIEYSSVRLKRLAGKSHLTCRTTGRGRCKNFLTPAYSKMFPIFNGSRMINDRHHHCQHRVALSEDIVKFVSGLSQPSPRLLRFSPPIIEQCPSSPFFGPSMDICGSPMDNFHDYPWTIHGSCMG